MKHLILIVAALALTGCIRKGQHVSIPGLTLGTPAPATSHVILVSGQSNMVRFNPAGYAGFSSVVRGNNTFINCAGNGATLQQLSSPAYWDPCIQKVGIQKIDLILFWQGESETNPTLASAGASPVGYAERLTSFFNRMRTQFGNVPIIYAQIGVVNIATLPDFTDWQAVKDEQANVRMSGVTMVKIDDITAGSPLTTDGIHYDDPGDYEVGVRMGRAYMGME